MDEYIDAREEIKNNNADKDEDGDEDGNEGTNGDNGNTGDGNEGANGDNGNTGDGNDGTTGDDGNTGDGNEGANGDDGNTGDGNDGTTGDGDGEGVAVENSGIAKLKVKAVATLAHFMGKNDRNVLASEDGGIKVFRGTIEVEEVTEKENLLDKLMEKVIGLLGGAGGKNLGDKLEFQNIRFIVEGNTYNGGETIEIDNINSVDLGISFDWKLSDNDYNKDTNPDGFNLENGDYAELKLPTFLKGVASGQQPLTETTEGKTRVIGYFEITPDSKLKVTFGDHEISGKDPFDKEFLTQSNRYGSLGMALNLDPTGFEDNHEQTVHFEAPIDKTFTFKAKPDPSKVSAIKKKGEPNQATNPTAIIWELEVNTELANIGNAIIKDTIPAGLALTGKIEVYDLAVGVDGKTTPATTPSKTITGAVIGSELKIELGKLDGKAVLVKYTTSIEDYEMEGYTNLAKLYNGEIELGNDKATVVKQVMNASITKTAIPPEKNATSITWVVDINKNQTPLNNVTVLDAPISPELSIKANSVKVYELNLLGTTWTKGTEIKTFAKNFPLPLGNIEANKAYRIEFETDIDYESYSESHEFKNKVILAQDYTTSGDTETYTLLDTAEAAATVYRDPLLIKEGIEVTGYNDTGLPKIEWIIKINQGKANIYEALLKDNIGNGLKLLPDTITVDSSFIKDNIAAPKTNANLTDNYLEIEFGNITGPHIIKYQTEVTGTNTSGYTNEASLTGKGRTGIGAGVGGYEEYKIEKSASTSPQLKRNIYTKKAIGSPDYTFKTIEWQITIDAMKERVTELKVEDLLDNQHLLFLDSPLEVYKHSTKLNKGSDYTLTLKEDSAVKGFTIVFNTSLLTDKAAYTIKYKTSFDPDAVKIAGGTPKAGDKPSYTNTVNITGKVQNPITNLESIINAPLSATHKINQDVHNLGKKEGKLDRDNRTMTWGIYVNVHGRDLMDASGVKITDTWSEGQKLVEGSLFVREFTLPVDGKLEPPTSGTKIEQADFDTKDIIYTSKTNGFDLKFDKGIAKAYYIEYQTKAVGLSEEKYTNTATVTDKYKTHAPYKASVNFPNYDEFINKTPISEAKGTTKVYKDDEIVWSVIVNESLSEIEDAKFVDTISAGHVYVKNTLKVYKGSVDDTNLLIEDSSAKADEKKYKLNVTVNADKTTILEVELGNITSKYIITYNTAVVTPLGEKTIKNTALLKGKAGFSEGDKTESKDYTVSIKSWGTGTGTSPYKGAIVLTKVDDKAGTPDPVKGAKFKLYYKLNDVKHYLKDEEDDPIIFETDKDGKIIIEGLPKGRTYTFEEVSAPAGYEWSGTEAERTAGRTIEPGTDKDSLETEIEADKKIVNKKLRNITVEKVWIGPGKTKTWPKSLEGQEVQFTLYAKDVVKETFKMNASTKDLTHTFENQPFYDEHGVEITYTIKEDVIAGYTLLNEVSGKTGFVALAEEGSHPNLKGTFNNKNINDKITLPVEKIWCVENSADKKEITVVLTQDKTKQITLNEGNSWKNGFAELMKYDNNGTEIIYDIDEVGAIGFKVHKERKDKNDITKGYKLTNIELMDIPVTKNWIGTPKADEVKFTLHEKKDGLIQDTVIATLNINGAKSEHAIWSGGKFENIPKYTVGGAKIDYGIKEVVPVGFRQVSIEKVNETDITKGFTVTNMEQVEVKVTKNWIGPLVGSDAIYIQLYKKVGDSGAVVEVAGKKEKVTGDKEKVYTFSGLDKYEVNGVTKTEINYSVDEDLTSFADKYEKTLIGSSLDYTITNKNIQKIDIPVVKKWAVGDGTTKPAVTINLLAAGKIDPVETKTLNGSETPAWKHTFTGLPKYDIEGSSPTGNAINYSIKEVSLGGFVTSITGNKTDGFVVTNIETMTIEVTKNWIGAKKGAVVVGLYEGVTQIGAPITLNEAFSWEGEFTSIPKYKANGDSINYTVKETPISGYETKVTGTQEIGFTITNREQIDITGTKVWVNGPDARPNIQLQLYRDDVALKDADYKITLDGIVDEKETTPWKYTWVNLPATDTDSEKYEYRVDEVNVPENYNKSSVIGDMASGFTITNTYVSPQIPITATKLWEGGSPTDRPTVWFKLYRAIGASAATEVLPVDIKKLESGTTSVTWTGQDETDSKGNKYTYSVKEVGEGGKELDDAGKSWQPLNYVKTENGLEVTNSYNSPTSASLKAIKAWDGGPSPKPTVWFKLYRQIEGGAVQEVKIPEVTEPIKALPDGTTEVVWTELTKTDGVGNPYTYSVQEVDALGNLFVPENYEVSYKHNDDKKEQTVTNTYVSPKIFITLTKSWENGPKPEVNIKVFRNSIYYVTVTLKSPDWTFDLVVDKTDANGNDYVYTVKEANVANYTSSVVGNQNDGFKFTNTYEIPKTSITARKDWIGGSALSSVIELLLYRNGNPLESEGSKISLDGTEKIPWTYIWENLDKTDINGNVYDYTVDEVAVPSGYNKSVKIEDGVIVITNTKQPSGGGGGGYTPPEKPKEDPKDKPKEDPKDKDKEKEDPKKEEPKKDDKDPKDPEKVVEKPEEPKDPGTGKPEDPFKEETTEETPKTGEVEVPEDSTPKLGEEPKNGTVTVDEKGKWTYTPNPGFVGKDSFTIIVTDENGAEKEIFFEMEVDEVPLGVINVPGKLPKTGADSYLGYYLLGVGLILLGVGMRRKYN